MLLVEAIVKKVSPFGLDKQTVKALFDSERANPAKQLHKIVKYGDYCLPKLLAE